MTFPDQRVAKNIQFNDFFGDKEPRISVEKVKIPEFQRNYVWDVQKAKNLFDSIQDNEFHYIGNIVTIADVTCYQLLDGQQRLITITLALAALRFLVEDDEIKEKISSIILKDPSKPRIIFSREKLKTAFEEIILNNKIKHSTDPSVKKINEMYNFFLCEYIKNIDDKKEFFKKILETEFVVINCKDEEDAFKLFEGLNSTGLSLSPVDLIKNAFLGEVKLRDSTKLETFVQKWEKIENRFEDYNINWFLRFLRYDLFQSVGYIGNSQLYEVKKLNIKNRNISDLEKLIDAMEIGSYNYVILRSAEIDNSYFKKMSGPLVGKTLMIISSINELGLEQVYSLIFAMLSYGIKNASYFSGGGGRSSFYSNLEKIWYFILLIKFTKISPSSFEKDFAVNCKKIFDTGEFEKDFFPDLFKTASGNRDVFEEIFNEKFASNKFTCTTKFLLNEFWSTFNYPVKPEDITIEHIIPQKDANIKWKSLAKKSPKEIHSYIHRIGNLSLLESSLNTHIDGFEFDVKVTNGYNESKLRIINENLIKYQKDFNSDPFGSVEKRGKQLSGEIYDFIIGKLSS